ncbi:uncharacterized protein BDV17DRAFT_252459 [Aspergillus undulatus]|uniref:uncharacterized protein n=1 Tax=Aspergillus undulatus TaxID=1810928 RepID=UPI003CCCD539
MDVMRLSDFLEAIFEFYDKIRVFLDVQSKRNPERVIAAIESTLDRFIEVLEIVICLPNEGYLAFREELQDHTIVLNCHGFEAATSFEVARKVLEKKNTEPPIHFMFDYLVLSLHPDLTWEFLKDAKEQNRDVYIQGANKDYQMWRSIRMETKGVVTDEPALLHEKYLEFKVNEVPWVTQPMWSITDERREYHPDGIYPERYV